jgi:hypothetical protein
MGYQIFWLVTTQIGNEPEQAQKRPKVFGRTQIHSCVNSRSIHSTAQYKYTRIMLGYTLRKHPIHTFAETTQNEGWIRPQFVVYNHASGCVDGMSPY